MRAGGARRASEDRVSNAEQYHFADFTRTNHRRLLQLARQHYVFRTFVDFQRDERFVLWRHDVDLSMHAARRLAEIEAEEQVRATYFLHLHSEFYNLFEKEVFDAVKAIAALGHQLGLHFDAAFSGTSEEAELERLVAIERAFIEDLLGLPLVALSFHIASPFTQTCCRPSYGGLVNANSEYLHSEVGYCSDSNGYWRFQRLEDVLRDGGVPRLQVLTHPGLWQDTVMSPRQRVHRCIDGRAEKTKAWYDRILGVNDRQNVDWI
jgi:hypothetical protein